MEPSETTQAFYIPPAMTDAQLWTLLDDHYSVETEAAGAHEVTAYDTFDWDLWFSDLMLMRQENRLYLFELSSDSSALALTSSVEGALPDFADGLPDSALKTKLVGRCGLRALKCRATLTWDEKPAVVRNADGKIVVRLALSLGEQTGRVLSVRPLRGFQDEQVHVETLLQERGLTPADQGGIVARMRNQLNAPAHPPCKPPLTFTADVPARAAMLEMISKFVNVARINEAGMIDDIDTEFLHQYRVAIRKARSVIQQLRDVLPEPDRLQLKDMLGDMARQTNLLRDLDVYLLEESSYREMLPDALRSGLDVMFKDYADHRAAEQQAVAGHLASAEYQSLTARVNDYLLPGRTIADSPNAMTPIGQLAATRIRKRYKRIIKLGLAIDETTPDEEVHELRIDCKKLRYLLEFFSDLFDADQVKQLIKALKRLQGVLGTFNDLSVQQESILAYAATKEEGRRKMPTKLAMAIGGLIAVLNREQSQVRQGVVAAFADFGSRDTKVLVKAMTASYVADASKSKEGQS